MSNTFQDILNTRVDDVEKPKPLPVGTYLCMINGAPTIGPIGEKQTLAAKFQLKPLQAQGDIDQQALSEAVGTKSLGDRVINHTLFLTGDALWRTKEFLQHAGVHTEGRTIGESLSDVVNRQLMVKIKHRPAPDGSQIFAEVGSTAAV